MSDRVRRIRVEIETVDYDGEVTVHTVEGEPRQGVSVSLEPHYRTQISRSRGAVVANEIVDAYVRIEGVIPHPLYIVTHPGHDILPIAESLADNLTSHSIAPVLPIRDQSGEAS